MGCRWGCPREYEINTGGEVMDFWRELDGAFAEIREERRDQKAFRRHSRTSRIGQHRLALSDCHVPFEWCEAKHALRLGETTESVLNGLSISQICWRDFSRACDFAEIVSWYAGHDLLQCHFRFVFA